MALASLLLRKGGGWPWTSSYHFQKEGGKVAMTSALLSLTSGGVWSWSPPMLLLDRMRGNIGFCHLFIASLF